MNLKTKAINRLAQQFNKMRLVSLVGKNMPTLKTTVHTVVPTISYINTKGTCHIDTNTKA